MEVLIVGLLVLGFVVVALVSESRPVRGRLAGRSRWSKSDSGHTPYADSGWRDFGGGCGGGDGGGC